MTVIRLVTIIDLGEKTHEDVTCKQSDTIALCLFLLPLNSRAVTAYCIQIKLLKALPTGNYVVSYLFKRAMAQLSGAHSRCHPSGHSTAIKIVPKAGRQSRDSASAGLQQRGEAIEVGNEDHWAAGPVEVIM